MKHLSHRIFSHMTNYEWVLIAASLLSPTGIAKFGYVKSAFGITSQRRGKVFMLLAMTVLLGGSAAFAKEIQSATFLEQFPNSYSCQAAEMVDGEQVGRTLGRIQISILGRETENPVIQVVSSNGKINFKIGNGFIGSLGKSVFDCGYVFLDSPLRMFYGCGLEVTNPASFRQVLRSRDKVMFSQDRICEVSSGASVCMHLSSCK